MSFACRFSGVDFRTCDTPLVFAPSHPDKHARYQQSGFLYPTRLVIVFLLGMVVQYILFVSVALCLAYVQKLLDAASAHTFENNVSLAAGCISLFCAHVFTLVCSIRSFKPHSLLTTIN